MRIETRYDIGFTYWVARVYPRMVARNIIIDGKLYTRMEKLLEPLAVKKVITGINITVYGDGSIRKEYTVITPDDYNEFDLVYSDENDRIFLYEDEALKYAISKLHDTKESYYGEVCLEDWDFH